MNNIYSKNNEIFFYAESRNGIFLPSSYEIISYCRQLLGIKYKKITAVSVCNNISKQEFKNLIYHGADKIIAAHGTDLQNFLIEPYSNILCNIISKYKPDIFLASATSNGRTLLPYAAMQLKTGLTADCTVLKIDPDTGLLLQTRPAIGGNIMATIKTPSSKPQMATVRPNSINPPAPDKSRKGEIINFDLSMINLSSKIEFKEFIPNPDTKCITDSKIVVAVGKGIKKRDNLPIIFKFAESIGAAVGASREVIDRGWLDYSHQIGLSGKTITPKLYIGIGISGAIQHLAGMQTSKHIIAINSDPEANIFRIADMGIIGDLFSVLPSLTEKINEMKIQK